MQPLPSTGARLARALVIRLGWRRAPQTAPEPESGCPSPVPAAPGAGAGLPEADPDPTPDPASGSALIWCLPPRGRSTVPTDAEIIGAVTTVLTGELSGEHRVLLGRLVDHVGTALRRAPGVAAQHPTCALAVAQVWEPVAAAYAELAAARPQLELRELPW